MNGIGLRFSATCRVKTQKTGYEYLGDAADAGFGKLPDCLGMTPSVAACSGSALTCSYPLETWGMCLN